MYHNKNLNRGKIVESIRNYCSIQYVNYEVSDFIHKDSIRKRVEIIADGTSFYIDFHFRGNGTTTIDISGGQASHHDIKDTIAQHVLQNCVIGGEADVTRKCITAENISIDDFHAVFELIKESEYFGSITSEFKNNVTENYNFKGNMNENVSLFYYFSNNKVMVQGRPLLLFYEILSCISELVDLDKLPNVFKDYYTIDLVKDAIEEQLQQYFPNSYNNISGKFKRVLCQCVYNLNLDGDMFDYTFLVFPALRALEGHIKNILYNYDIEYDREKGFNMFVKNAARTGFCLASEFQGKISRCEIVDYLGEAYTALNAKRNRLFHWGESSELDDDTILVKNLGEAKQMIIDTVVLIDKYYRLIAIH